MNDIVRLVMDDIRASKHAELIEITTEVESVRNTFASIGRDPEKSETVRAEARIKCAGVEEVVKLLHVRLATFKLY